MKIELFLICIPNLHNIYKTKKSTKTMGIMQLFKKTPQIKPGAKTTEGLRLKLNPSLSDPPEVKFAPFSDDRILDSSEYLKFQDFLPKEIKLIGPPDGSPEPGRNCWGYTHGDRLDMPAAEFRRSLNADYQQFMEEDIPQFTLLVYAGMDDGADVQLLHAGIYQGEGIVRSRWCDGGPVVEHPIEEVLPTFYHSLLGPYTLNFRL